VIRRHGGGCQGDGACNEGSTQQNGFKVWCFHAINSLLCPMKWLERSIFLVSGTLFINRAETGPPFTGCNQPALGGLGADSWDERKRLQKHQKILAAISERG
jgi:hypothetical protein